MSGRLRCLLASGMTAAWAAACSLPPVEPPILFEGPVRIEIASPDPGSSLRLRTLRVPVRGLVRLPDARPDRLLDAFVLVDVSAATRHPSGQDVDGDGEVGFDPHRILVDLEPGGIVCTDPEDSILHAEVAAVGRLLDHLHGSASRVGLAFFSRSPDRGEGEPASPLALASDFADLRAALDRVLREPGPAGSFEQAMEGALRELRGARPSARRLLLVLASQPRQRPVADRAEGIEVGSWVVGQAAAPAPGRPASRSLRHPVDLLAWLDAATADREAPTLEIRNLDLRTASQDVFLATQGRFSGWLPVQEGSNQLLVRLRRQDGALGTARFRVHVERELPTHWELLQQLEEIRRGNRELLSLIEGRGIREKQPGELEIHVPP